MNLLKFRSLCSKYKNRVKGQGKPCDTLLICSKECIYHKHYGEFWCISICPYIKESYDFRNPTTE